MSGENSAGNNWTILTPEESAAETLRPLAEGTEHHEPDSGASQSTGGEASSDAAPVEEHMVSSSSVSVSDAHKNTENLPEAAAQSSSDPESFSESYTHITPSADEASDLQPSTETLRGEDFSPPDELRPIEQEALPSHHEEQIQQEDDETGSPSRIPTSAQQEETSERPEKGEDPELRRRKTLLASLEEIGAKEEEEEVDEEFQVPHREEDGGITLNKCIIGAVILLGLGTIFISGVFMDLDQEGDFGKGNFADNAAQEKQWFSKDAPPPPADADATELLNHLTKGKEQISVLQAQLQAQNAELKVAKEQIADGAKERLLWEEMGEENSRLKTQAASLSLLQNENERMKRELESVRSLQQEVEILRSTVTELKRSSAREAAHPPVKTATSPFSGQAENSRQDTTARKLWSNQREKKEKYDTGENKSWSRGEKSERQQGEKKERREGDDKEWGKEQTRFDKMKNGKGKEKRRSEETEPWKKNESKKDKKGRGDEGKPWKDRGGRREETEKSERKNRKDAKDWRKGKHEKEKEGEEEKDWKRAKDHREKQVGHKDRKDKREWKKDWKKGERKEWRKDGEWSDKDWKDGGKERKHQGERKQGEGSEHHSKRHSHERNRKDERRHWEEEEWMRKKGKDRKEKKRKDEGSQWERKRGQEEMGHSEDGKKDHSRHQNHKDGRKMSGDHHHEESLWTEDSTPKIHRRLSLAEPEYWAHQRERLLRNPTPPQDCETPEACAATDGLLPVPYSEFDGVLQKYITKAEEAGVEASKREELKKLAAEFFKDGVFAHNQMSFHDFADDLGDILEDMVEEDDEDGQEEDSVLEDEMEEFEREVLRKFSLAGGAKKEGRNKEELKKESGRGRG